METNAKTPKPPMAQEKIFKTMLTLTMVVATVFLLKNLISQTWPGAIAVGICLAIFAGVVTVMKNTNVSQYHQQMVLCCALPLLVFFISIFSGNFYSDDFPLYLAVVGISGLYLEPAYTRLQMIEIPVLLVLLYFINSGKADPLSQYIMCIVLFEVATYTILLVIRRGRAFIDLSMQRAKEAEKLLESITTVGEELRENYENSSGRIDGMQKANATLERNTTQLKNGSHGITEGTKQVESSCDEVQEYVRVTEEHIEELNKEVLQVEDAMSESKSNLLDMDRQMQSVKRTVGETKAVFTELQEQIVEITKVTEQLTAIAGKTKMLALNASIEAARAGEAGVGFAIVASQVQELAVDSDKCSSQVNEVVDNMKNQIEITSKQLEDSDEAIEESLASLGGLEGGFDGLIGSLGSLCENIEEQNQNVQNVESIFGTLREKVGEMSLSSGQNQEVVDSIIEAVNAYKEHMNVIIEDVKEIHDLSGSMLEISKEEIV